MFHPFLIVPAVGALIIALSSLNMAVSVFIFICIFIAAITLIQSVRPAPHPVHVRDDDHARVFFQIYHDGEVNHIFFPGRGEGRPLHDEATGVDVHEHEIQSNLRSNLEKLKRWSGPFDKELTIAQIKEYIFNGYIGSYKKKEDAYSVLRSIEKINGRLSSVNMSEMDILCMVWQRIESPLNKDIKEDLKSNLLELLAESSIKLDVPYCLVGRITRIVHALMGLDKEGINVDISSELQEKIPVLITRFFCGHETEKARYDNGEEEIAKELKEYVKSELCKEYIDIEPQLDKLLLDSQCF